MRSVTLAARCGAGPGRARPACLPVVGPMLEIGEAAMFLPGAPPPVGDGQPSWWSFTATPSSVGRDGDARGSPRRLSHRRGLPHDAGGGGSATSVFTTPARTSATGSANCRSRPPASTPCRCRRLSSPSPRVCGRWADCWKMRWRGADVARSGSRRRNRPATRWRCWSARRSSRVPLGTGSRAEPPSNTPGRGSPRLVDPRRGRRGHAPGKPEGRVSSPFSLDQFGHPHDHLGLLHRGDVDQLALVGGGAQPLGLGLFHRREDLARVRPPPRRTA